MEIDINPLVSIVVPVYNVEPYLLQCLNSIENQTYTNFECIIIVDGATDRSYEISKKYCKEHSRFKVFYQDNAGSGPARNNGIKHSLGEFICFVDPDDWVENNYVESLIVEQQRGDFDLVVLQSIRKNIDKHGRIVSSIKNNKPALFFHCQKDCRENFPFFMFEHHYLDGPICKLFRMSIIKKHNIEFPAYRRSQDMVFNFRYYNYINSISTANIHIYNIRYEYPARPGRGRIFKGYDEIVLKIYLEISEQLKVWNISNNYKQLLHTWSFWYLYAYLSISLIPYEKYCFLESEPFWSIVKYARPKLLSQKLIRFLLYYKMYFLANILIKVIKSIKSL